jgi:hypothetical protein
MDRPNRTATGSSDPMIDEAFDVLIEGVEGAARRAGS